MRKIFTLLFCAASLATGLAQQESYFTNPVIHGDVADPSIIRIDQTISPAPPRNGPPIIRFSPLPIW